MLNRYLSWIGITALFVILALNVVPTFWNSGLDTYIAQEMVNGMAIKHQGLLYTLNFDQQKRVIQILNRSIPVGDLKSGPTDPQLNFEEIIIYRFNQPDIHIQPIAWVEKNLLFKAPEWSQSNLMEVSKGQLFSLISTTYDK